MASPLIDIPGQCGNLTKNSLLTSLGRRVSMCFISGKYGLAGYTPYPTPLKSLDWRGVCKNGLQNLEPQGFRGQNLDNKGLAVFLAVAVCTASALTIFCFLACGWQGRMSHHECDPCGFQAFRRLQRARKCGGASMRPLCPGSWSHPSKTSTNGATSAQRWGQSAGTSQPKQSLSGAPSRFQAIGD